MIYIKNNDKTQTVYIPKEDGIIIHSGGGGDCSEAISQAYSSGWNGGQGYGYNVGYEDGIVDGEDKQKRRLGHLDATENGEYENSASGWSSVTITVPQSGHSQQELDEAYESGITHQKSLLTSTAITTNTTVINGNGFSSVTVNVPQTGHTDQEMQAKYNLGYSDGVAHQKSLLSTTAITSNGEYTSENGWEEISVQVPQNNPAIEQSKGFTATTNGTSAITPSAIWHIDHSANTYNTYYYFTINGTISSGYYGTAAYRLDYNKVEDYGYVLIKINSQGGLEMDTTNYDQEAEPVTFRYGDGVYSFTGSRISASNFDVQPLNNVEYYYAMSSVTITVDVPPQGAVIEHSKSYTATTNGSHTITPTGTWEVTCDTSRDDYYLFKIEGVLSGSQYVHRQLYRLDYNGEEDYGYILVVVNDNGDNLALNINHYDQESHPVGYRNESDGTHFYGNPASAFTVTPLDYKEELYDAMDSVELTVNVDMTASYNSGYTAGENAIKDTFTSMTATTNGVYGSSAQPLTAVTVNVTNTNPDTLVGLYCNWATFDFPLSPLGESVSLLSANIGFSGSSTTFARIAGGASSAYTEGMPNYIIAKITGNSLSGITASDSGTTTITPTMFPSGDDLYFNKNKTYKVGYGSRGVYQLGGTTFSLNAWHLYMNGYLFNVCSNGQYKCYYPYVDYQGRAALMYNGNVIYPTSGSVYPVYYDSASNEYYIIKKDILTV